MGVFASHPARAYTTKVDATRTPVHELVIGHTLPRRPRPAAVRLGRRRVKRYKARQTNRGLELTVSDGPEGSAHPDHHDD